MMTDLPEQAPTEQQRQPCSTCGGTGWISQEGQHGAPGSGCTHGCPDCDQGCERLATGELHDEDAADAAMSVSGAPD